MKRLTTILIFALLLLQGTQAQEFIGCRTFGGFAVSIRERQ